MSKPESQPSQEHIRWVAHNECEANVRSVLLSKADEIEGLVAALTESRREVEAFRAERDALLKQGHNQRADNEALRRQVEEQAGKLAVQGKATKAAMEGLMAASADKEKLCRLLREAEKERDEAMDIARHTHEARYFKAEDGKMKLMDACNRCGLDLRHSVHSTPPESEARPSGGV